MPNQVIKIEFPINGINRDLAYTNEPPTSTPDAVNVRPYDPLVTRLRGGSRPALVPFKNGAYALTGNASKVNMMATVGWISTGTQVETLCWASGGAFWYSSPAAAGVQSTGAVSSTSLFAAEMLQKLYVNSAGTIYTFDPSSPATLGAFTATAGTVPTGTTLICSYRDRLVLAGPDHTWYMSRQQTPTDWNYGADADDGGRAIAATVSDAGSMGTPITALIPMGNEYLLFGGPNSLWRLTGDPAWGGRQDCISHSQGIVGPTAWCSGPSGELYFLSRSGLNMLFGPAPPQTASADTLPADLRNLDAVGNSISMGYDRIGRGLNLFVTPTGGTAGKHWFYHIPTKSWWREQYVSTQQPMLAVDFAPDRATPRYTVMGSYDGNIRTFDATGLVTTDDGSNAISSYVYLGPFMPGNDLYTEGVLMELAASMASASNTLSWAVYVGDDAEEAFNSSTVFASGTFPAGRGMSNYVQARGVAVTIKLYDANPWSFESLTGTVRKAGKVRSFY